MKLSPEDSAALDGQSRICNWAYNHLLERAISERQKFITSNDKEAFKLVYSKRGLRDLLPELKKDHRFLQSVHSSPMKNAALRLSASIEAYQKSRKGSRRATKRAGRGLAVGGESTSRSCTMSLGKALKSTARL